MHLFYYFNWKVWWVKMPNLLQEQAKIRMMKKKGSDKTESYWSNLWGSPKDIQNKGELFL